MCLFCFFFGVTFAWLCLSLLHYCPSVFINNLPLFLIWCSLWKRDNFILIIIQLLLSLFILVNWKDRKENNLVLGFKYSALDWKRICRICTANVKIRKILVFTLLSVWVFWTPFTTWLLVYQFLRGWGSNFLMGANFL